MSVKWTTEQQNVIDFRNRNILVSAAAGSGKTAVLVERIITMLTKDEPPMDVDRLLIVTFTEAAAAEMKERIRGAIEKKLEECPDNEHLMQQATLIHNAQITTIHSFCLSVIRDHFHAIDIDPGFRIGEEGELKLLKHEVLDEILEEQYAEKDPVFLDFSTAYGGRNDKNTEELILDIYEYSRSYPDADSWLSSCVNAYEISSVEELEESFYIRLVKDKITRHLEEAKERLQEGLLVCLEADGPYVYEDTLRKDLKILEELSAKSSYVELSEYIKELKWPRIAINKDKTVSEEKVLYVKGIREDVKSLVKDLISQYFYESVDGILEDLAECLPAVEKLVELVKMFAKRFEEKKQAQNMIDFSDMEQYAFRILTRKSEDGFIPSAIAKEYQQQYAEIMIDEYQDSNLIQEAILTSVSGVHEGRYNIFMVGDVKQSIYRFRLSRPELFMEKSDTYTITESEKQRIDLHKNFRSRKEVLEGINYMFRQIMDRSLGGITYDDESALYAGAKYPEGKNLNTEILVIDTKLKNKDISDREIEARAVAAEIRKLMAGQKVLDKKTGKMRNIRYSDIVILTRSIRGYADVFAEVLTNEGIPAFVGTREGYFSAQEIGVILSYLRVLDNRKQDIPLAAVLASAIGNLTEQELAVIRSAYKEENFHQAVELYRNEGEDAEICRKLEKCLGDMDEIRSIVPYTPMHELLWKILEETGYEDYVSAMPGGEQRRANLEMLVEKARAFEATSYKGLFHFVRYVEQLQKYDVDYGEASLEDENSNTVRIMTIHKSKGLEFPVVFVVGMGKHFNLQDARSSVVLHAKLGIGMDAVYLDKRMKIPSIVKKAIQKEEVLDTLGEELRILYVAFTRAKEKLYISGTLSDLEKKMSSYETVRKRKEECLSYGMRSKASTYLDWILPALVRLTPEIPIQMKYVSMEDIVASEIEEEFTDQIEKAVLKNWNTEVTYEAAVKVQMEEQFSYQYPYAGSRSQKLKYTVSELKKMIHEEETGEIVFKEEEVVPLLPKFLQEEEELTGANRGSAYHRLLELLDFRTRYDSEILEKDIINYIEAGKLSKEMADCIRRTDILGFLDSEAGQRMAAAAKEDSLWKEQPFVLGIDAKEIYPEEQENELVLVQGIIDVYFEEEDGLVVLDYKTDRVSRAEELVERYHGQLDYYAKALEQLRGKKVKEKLIYSFTLKKLIKL